MSLTSPPKSRLRQVSRGTSEDRQRVALADVEGEPRRTRSDQSAERNAKGDKSKHTSQIGSSRNSRRRRPEATRPNRRRTVHTPRRSGERPETHREKPNNERQRHPGDHRGQGQRAAEPVGKSAEKETPGRAANTNRAQEKHGRGLRHTVIERVRNEVDERHKHAERAEQTGDKQPGETWRFDRLNH